jgi:hypothetical protein
MVIVPHQNSVAVVAINEARQNKVGPEIQSIIIPILRGRTSRRIGF